MFTVTQGWISFPLLCKELEGLLQVNLTMTMQTQCHKLMWQVLQRKPSQWVSLHFVESFQTRARFTHSKCPIAEWLRVFIPFLVSAFFQIIGWEFLIIHQICAAVMKIILLFCDYFHLVSVGRLVKITYLYQKLPNKDMNIFTMATFLLLIFNFIA